MKLTELIEVSNYTDVVLYPGTCDSIHWKRIANCDEWWRTDCCMKPCGWHSTEGMSRMIKHYLGTGHRIVISGSTVNIMSLVE
jgi:hypothetical protein